MVMGFCKHAYNLPSCALSLYHYLKILACVYLTGCKRTMGTVLVAMVVDL